MFIDSANLSMNGGGGMDYGVLYKFVQGLGVQIIRANVYMPHDTEAEADPEVKKRREGYRHFLRKSGFRVSLKRVKKYPQENGSVNVKANTDMEMAVDALLQTENLDYVLLGTGDGDFTRLVQALQDRGKRVDVLSFENSSRDLRAAADYAHDGLRVRGLVPHDEDHPETSAEVRTGYLHAFNEEKGFGFITSEENTNIFVHVKDVLLADGNQATNADMVDIKNRKVKLEFDIIPGDNGRMKAVNVEELVDTE